MKRCLFFLLLVALILGGCRFVGIGRDEDDEVPEAPAVTPVPTLIRETEPPLTETPLLTPTPTAKVDVEETVKAEEAPLDFSSVSDLSFLDSYRLTQRAMRISEAGERSVIELTKKVSRFPKVVRLAFAFADGGKGHMEIIRAAGTSYVTFGEEWRSTSLPPGAIVGERNWMPDPAEFLGEGMGTYVSEGRLNDLRAKHYHYDRDALDTGGRAAEVMEGSADVWVSTEHQVYLKILLHWKGLTETGGTITYQMESMVHDVNEPLKIEIPAAVDRPGVPYDVPLMAGARDVSVRGDIIIFDVGTSPQDVMAFYAARMPARGWQLREGRVALLLRFAKRGRAVNVLVKSEEGTTTVILVQEGGGPGDT